MCLELQGKMMIDRVLTSVLKAGCVLLYIIKNKNIRKYTMVARGQKKVEVINMIKLVMVKRE